MDITRKDFPRHPWQSTLLINYHVPSDLRWDIIVSSKELFFIPFTDIFNHMKVTIGKKYAGQKFPKVVDAIDPTVPSDWIISAHMSYQNEFGNPKPFAGGFMIARKEIIPGLWSVSIAVCLKR